VQADHIRLSLGCEDFADLKSDLDQFEILETIKMRFIGSRLENRVAWPNSERAKVAASWSHRASRAASKGARGGGEDWLCDGWVFA
jgi:hypothetical protein